MPPQLEQLRESLPRLKELLLHGDSIVFEDLEKMFSKGIHPIMVRQILDHTLPCLHGTLHETDVYSGKTEAILEFQKAIVLVYEIASANDLKPFPPLNYVVPPEFESN